MDVLSSLSGFRGPDGRTNEGIAISRGSSNTTRRSVHRPSPAGHAAGPVPRLPVRRIASNFAVMGFAEVVCRAISVVLTLSLTRRLGPSGFGRIEFAFNIVFWLVLIVRDCFETIITREIARHPRLTRALVNHVLAVKLTLAPGHAGGALGVRALRFLGGGRSWVLILYGLLLLTTALGLDFVFRARETMGLIAVSLCVRTSVYCAGVWYWVSGPSQVLLVPLWLAAGEITGIALVWAVYAREYGLPRPVLGPRFLAVFFRRGRSVGLIHLCQAVIISADLLVVGVLSPYGRTWDLRRRRSG